LVFFTSFLKYRPRATRTTRGSFLHRIEEGANHNSERFREADEGEDGDVIAGFDAPEITRVDLHPVGQVLLRPPVSLS
jgi:hypothetical protein